MYKIYDKYGHDLAKVIFKDWDQVSSSLCQKTVFSYEEFRKFDGDVDKTNTLIEKTGLKVVRVMDIDERKELVIERKDTKTYRFELEAYQEIDIVAESREEAYNLAKKEWD